MTSPDLPDLRAARGPCRKSACDQPAVVSAAVCRVHLVDGLRAEGEVIPWEDGDFAGVAAAAIHIVRVAFEGVPLDMPSQAPSIEMDMYALLPMDSEWALAQMSLDFLGTHMADTFGAMRLSPPSEFMSKVLLRLRVAGPGTADELRPRLMFAMEAMIREFVRSDVELTVAVEPPEIEESSATGRSDD